MPTADTSKKPVHRDWHKADIKAALEKRGYTLRRFSFEHGYSHSAAQKALRTAYPVMEALIAQAIGTFPAEIWPSRYDEDGRPLKGRAVGHPTSRSAARNVTARRVN